MTPAGPGFDTALLWLIAGWATLGLGALLLLWALFRDRSRGRRRCPKCWYDMTGVPGLRCPECGREARTEKKLHKTRRRYALGILSLCIILLGTVSTRVPRALKYGWLDAVPVELLRPALWWERDKAKELYERSNVSYFGSRGRAPTSSQWEQLLVASHCGRLIDDGVRAEADAGDRPEGRSAFRYLMDGLESPSPLSILDQLGRNARPAQRSLLNAVWAPDPVVSARSLCNTSIRLQWDLTTEFVRLARLHEDPNVRQDALECAVRCAMASNFAPDALTRMASATQKNVEATCKVLVAPNVRVFGDSSAAAAFFRAMLASPEPDIRAKALWYMSPNMLRALEHEVDGVYRLQGNGGCTAAIAHAAGAYSPKGDVWGPRLVQLAESQNSTVAANALISLRQWGQSADRERLGQWLRQLDMTTPAEVAREPSQWLLHRLVRNSEYDPGNMRGLVDIVTRSDTERSNMLFDILNQHRLSSYRFEAALALDGREIPADSAYATLTRIFDQPESGYFRQCVLDALAPSLHDDRRLNDVLSRALDDLHPGVVMSAVRLTGDAGPDDAIDAKLRTKAGRSDTEEGFMAQKMLAQRSARLQRPTPPS